MYRNPLAGCTEDTLFQQSSFHTHAGTGPNTCGSLPIDEVIAEYHRMRYGVVALTNHNLYSDPAPHRLTDVLVLGGYEYSRAVHICCIGAQAIVVDDHQGAIDSALSEGGFCVLCHPNWMKEYSFSKELLASLHGFLGLEIYNGSIDVDLKRNKEFNGEKSAPEIACNGRNNAPEAYDFVLSQGRLCWCFGNDDFHRWYMLARCWNNVFCEREAGAVQNALIAGRFYVSTGLVLREMTLKDDRLRVAVRNASGFVDLYRYRFVGRFGETLAETTGECGQYRLRGDELYVRVEVTASNGHMLYTQPVYDDSRMTLEHGR